MAVGWQLVESPTELSQEVHHCSGAGALVLLVTGWTVLTAVRGDKSSEKTQRPYTELDLQPPAAAASETSGLTHL